MVAARFPYYSSIFFIRLKLHLLQYFAHHFFHLRNNILRAHKLNMLAKAKYPAVELGADEDIHVQLTVLVVQLAEGDVLTKAVYEHAAHAVVHVELDFFLLAAVHAKGRLGIRRHVKILELLGAVALLVDGVGLEHLVHTVMFNRLAEIVKGNQIVILVVPGKRPGAYREPFSLVQDVLRFIRLPGEVFEADLPVVLDGVVDLVHAVIYALVHGLDPAVDKDLPLDLTGLILAHKALDLFDELTGFALGDEFRALDRIDKELDFRKLKFPGAHMVVGLPAYLLLDDLDPELLHVLKIGIDALALGGNIVPCEFVHDLVKCERMLVIRFLEHDLHKVREFELLVCSSGHSCVLRGVCGFCLKCL